MNHDLINTTSNVAVAIATVIGFGLTTWGVFAAKNQLQANNEYQIRSDLRATVNSVQPLISFDCILGDDCDENSKSETERGLAVLFNFFFSVYSQASTNSISKQFERELSQDFCRWTTTNFGFEFWKSQVERNNYGPERVDMKEDWCGDD